MDERKRDFSNGITCEIDRTVVDEIKITKENLASAVKELLIDFERETSLQVMEVNLVGWKDRLLDCVDIEVRLPSYMSKEHLEAVEKRFLENKRMRGGG